MADTTNDIWNDNDGEEDEAPRKGGRLRRFGIFFLVLAAVLGVVLVAAYRDGTGFDALRRLCSYGSGEESTAEAQYDYDASDSNRFAVLGDSLVVLSDTKLQVLARGGEEIWSTSVRMSAPALETGGGRAVAYDVGGTELYVVDEGGETGVIEQSQKDMIANIFEFDDITAEEIMTPRTDVAALEVEDGLDEALRIGVDEGYSRLPVYEEDIDHIIGTVHQKDFYVGCGVTDKPLVEILSPALFVLENEPISLLLKKLQSAKTQVAVVVDEYGGTCGIVTMEDILEELVGEIWDEDDEVVEPCVDHGDGSYSFDAGVDIEDAFEFMDYEDPDETDFDHKLLGEWAYEQFDAIPQEGDSFTYNGLRITVEKVQQRRIMKLHIQRLPEGGEKA